MAKVVYYLKLIFFLTLAAGTAFAAGDLPIRELVTHAEKSFETVAPVQFTTQEVSSVGPEIWDRIDVEYVDGKGVLRYLYSSASLKNELQIFRDLVFLNWIRNSTPAADEATLKMELLYNAAHKSAGSRWGLLHSLMDTFAYGSGLQVIEDNLKAMFQLIPKYKNLPIAELENIKMQIMTEIAKESERYFTIQTKDLRKRNKEWENWKKQTGTLDALDKAQVKLDDYVRNNDRAGARKLIEAYLPWPVMEPFETRMWKSWLDALERKPTKQESMILFRGVDFDTDSRFVSKDGKPGFMSTLLTRNQGNYNRRLRSLAVRRITNGGIMSDTESKAPQAVLISKQMAAHADDPTGSAFLSLTTSVHVTLDFVGKYYKKLGRTNGAFMAVRLHPSRAITNGPASYGYVGEREFLAPLILFPDDVIFYKERPEVLFTTDELMKDLKKVLTKNEYEAVEKIENSYASGKKEMIIEFFKSIERTVEPAPLCSRVL